jgi:CSLREA domain-containing protein
MNRLSLAACLSLALGPAHAATFTVTRLDDPAPNGCLAGDCSLREAVAAANALPGSDTVVLGSGTHVLQLQAGATAVTLASTGTILLRGAGRDATALTASGAGTLLALDGITATVRDLTLRDAVAGAATAGSAIRASGSMLWLDGVRLANNAAAEGGALYLVDTAADLAGTQVTGSRAADRGGGVYARNSPLRLRRGSSIDGIETGGYGGGVFTDDEVVADDDCAVTGNAAHYGGGIAGPYTASLYVRGVQTTGGDGLFEIASNVATGKQPMWQIDDGAGGGLYSDGGMYLERVAVRDNQSNQRGGGVAAAVGKLTMKDSVVSGNHAASTAGGIQSSRNDLVLERVGVHDNDAGMNGGGLVIGGSITETPASATLRNVDFHDNTAPSRAAITNNAVLTISHGTFYNNLSDTGRDAIAQLQKGSTNYRNTLLVGRCTTEGPAITSVAGNLRSSETPTPCPGTGITTLLLLTRGSFGGLFEIVGTSQAGALTNAGNANYCQAVDIRNRARGAACDVGAFEYGAQ